MPLQGDEGILCTEAWTLLVGAVLLQVMCMDSVFYYLVLKAPRAG